MNLRVQQIRSYRDDFERMLIEEIQREFKDYPHFNVGFGAILKSMTCGMSDPMLQKRSFQLEIKYELKLLMNYLHMVRDKNLIRDLKTSFFPMLLMGSGGNRTAVKHVILATHLSIKAMPFITETFQAIVSRRRNHDAEFIAELYAEMLSYLRRLNVYRNRMENCSDEEYLARKERQLIKAKYRNKNKLRAKLGLPPLPKGLNDPYRSLPLYRLVNGEYRFKGFT